MDLPRYDFTERHIFSRRFSNDISIFLHEFGFRIPWKLYECKPIRSDADLEEGYKEIFFTGFKEDILKKTELKNVFMSGDYCERCGVSFRRIPWEIGRKFPYLCEKCAKDLEREFGKDVFGRSFRKREIEKPWWLV